MENARVLEGRNALVTGGANGLGLAIAKRMALAGADITIVDLPGKHDNMPANWVLHEIDLLSDETANELASLASDLGNVDIVVANAGVVPPWRGMAELDLAEWDRVMRINVWGVAATLGAFAGALERSGKGTAVVMASLNGYKAHPKQVLYTASKHAVVGVVRAAALDLGPRGIRVNALAPGPIATDALISRVETRHATGGPKPGEALAGLAADAALGRIATQDDVANAALFLASDASAGMTGTILPVDGGLL
ncbi:MAG: SDR family NAD(P)-dependent oxidoreductase [Devosiaceae bacterium]